jgi:hypothetical protein
MKTPYIHIYGQAYNHSNAFIIGNYDGLMLLLRALEKTLHYEPTPNGDAVGTNFFVGDGEGYKIIIKETSNEEMAQLELPYTETYQSDYDNIDGKSPVELIGVDAYRKLFGK